MDDLPLMRESTLTSRVLCTDTDPRWHHFVSNHPGAGPFHQPEWATAVAHTFGYEKLCYVVEDSARNIVAACPAMVVKSALTGNRLVSMPFSHGAGPLVHSVEQARELLDLMIQDAQKLKAPSIELRAWPEEMPIPPQFLGSSDALTHIVPLSERPDELLTRMERDVRRSIRHAERGGVTARISESSKDLQVFYKLYLQQRKRQHLLPQPWAFVQSIFEQFVHRGKGYLTVAEYDREPVCALLDIGHGPRIVGLDTGSGRSARQLRAIYLATWRSLEEACSRGYQEFDFGRSSATATGLQHFKSKWGARAVPLSTLYYGRPSGVNTGSPSRAKRFILDVYTRVLPERAMAAVSAPIYRHLA